MSASGTNDAREAMPAVAVATVPFQGGFVEFERVEFGKYLIQRNGRIEAGAEHRQLGATRGFPASLLDDCDPSVLGVGGSLDEIPADCPHGSVLRPVFTDGETIPVFSRMRLRPEEGEGKEGRRYTVARYLVTPPGESVSPLAYFDAMEHEPVAGIIRQERDDLTPIRAAVRQLPNIDVDSAFVERAVTYIMSGVPVAIVTPLAEESFFAWATAVWLRLPPSVRPLLSFGWGVTDELAADFSMSYCRSGAPNNAAYDARSHIWTPPSKVDLAECESRPFEEDRTFPGRMFAHRTSNGNGTSTAPSSSADVSASFRILPFVELPRFPSMRHPGVIRIFRWPGLHLLDDGRFRDFENWIDQGPAAPPDAERFVGAFNYPETEHRALLLALSRAQARPQTTDAYFAAMASGGLAQTVEEELERGSRPNGIRARMIHTLFKGAASLQVLALVSDAAVAGQLENLDPRVTDQLLAAFDGAGFDFAATSAYAAILRLSPRPSFCTEWLRGNANLVALAFARWRPPGTAEALDALAKVAGEPLVVAVTAYVRGASPPKSALALRSADEGLQAAFARQLSSDWEMTGTKLAERRERILEWGVYVRPDPLRHPLARFAYGEHTETDIDAIATEIEQGRLPPTLQVQASAFALGNWKLLGARIRQRRGQWAPFTALWPSVARLVLLDDPPAVSEVVRQPIQEAFERLEIEADETEHLLRRWVPRLDENDLDAGEIAGFIWRLALQAEAGLKPTTCVTICRNIAAENFQLHADPTDEDLDLVKRVCVAAGENASDARGTPLFAEAARIWQIRLVLELYPRLPLVPTLAQLQVLARNHTWLRQHLARPDIVESRRNACRLALAGFHEYAYDDGPLRWQTENKSSFLWGAFRGVPIAEQGSLRAALEHYGHSRREQVEAARVYIASLSRGDQSDGVIRVIRDLLIPMFDEFFVRDGAKGRKESIGRVYGRALLRAVYERQHPPTTFVRRSGLALKKMWRRVAFQPRFREVSSNSAPPLREVRGRIINVADWLYKLLEKMNSDPGEIAEAFGRGGATA